MYQDIPILMQPGIYKEATPYAAKNRYTDGSNVRFWKGLPERIGGWNAITSDTTETPARGIKAWRALDGTQFLALGGASYLTLLQGGTLDDITPIDYISRALTVSSVSGTFTVGETLTGGTSSTTATLLVDGGTVLSVGSHSGEFTDGETITGGSSGATATVDSSTFGGTVDAEATYGWGDSTWSISVWGGVANLYSAVNHATTWSLANWGEDLIANPRGGKIYVWEKTGSPFAPAVQIASKRYRMAVSSVVGTFAVGETITGGTSSATATILFNDTISLVINIVSGTFTAAETITGGTSSATATVGTLTYVGSPSTCNAVFVADINRTLVALGAHDGTASDPLNIRWTDSEDYSEWNARATNTAGSLRCETGNEIIGYTSARGGYMISTDTSIYAFRYIGGAFVFGLTKVADGPSMIGPHSGVEVNGIAYFMGPDQFYLFDGTVRELPCDVHAYVYGRLNKVQRHKVFCATNKKFNEIWWFYPSAVENDSYVAFNYVERSWHIGDIGRTSWSDDSVMFNYPIGTDVSGNIFAHEYGTLGNGSAYSYSLETSDVELADGNVFGHARMVIPDWERISGTHTLNIEVRGHPQRAATTKGPYTFTSDTFRKSVRARGRQTRFLFSGADDFRLGLWKARMIPHGRKE